MSKVERFIWITVGLSVTVAAIWMEELILFLIGLFVVVLIVFNTEDDEDNYPL